MKKFLQVSESPESSPCQYVINSRGGEKLFWMKDSIWKWYERQVLAQITL